MRDGFEIIDMDTHVGPNVETLEIYAGPVLQRRWPELEPFHQPVTEGHHLSINPMPYKRALRTSVAGGDAEAGGKIPLRGQTKMYFTEKPAPEVNNLNWEGRIADMDREGVDVHLIFPATFATASSALDTEMQIELFEAYHRYLDDYCSSVPDRLKASILTTDRDPEWSSETIKKLSDKPWIGSVTLVLTEGIPIDDPVIDPIWAAMDEADLGLMHHSFFYEPPYFPGYRDIWGNLAVARMAAHPWGAQRICAFMMLSGLLDRFPNLRIGFSETSAGWVSGWMNRITYQQDYMAARLPETKMTPVEYARSGRLFCGVELDEGPEITRTVMDYVGDGVLMYCSDYPHGGCHFPESPDVVLGWRDHFSDDEFTKFTSGNAARFLRR